MRAHALFIICFFLALLPLAGQEKQPGYSGPKDKLHIYLLMGGRNMAGTAPLTEADKAVLDRCYLLTKENTWEKATAPLNRYSTVVNASNVHLLGPGLSFAKVLLKENPDISIGLIVNAKEESSIDEWHRKSKIYWAARKRMKVAAKTGTLKGILWHQGEDDLQNPEGYLEKLMDFITFFRTFLRLPDLPFVAGEVANGKSINGQLSKLPDRVHASGYASAQGLKAGADMRFEPESVKKLGERYATVMWNIHKSQVKGKTYEPAKNSNVIDAHIHAHSCTEEGLDALSKWMKKNNVNRSIVHPLNHKGSQPVDEAERQKMLENYRK